MADQTIAIGDGANDLKMMAAAGIGIAYHAKPLVQKQATYALNNTGLEGAIYLLTT
jgi:phosphoserine phosphatase